MATGVVTWSQTAASNSNADGNVNWSEGMAPSQVDDSARAVMASVAKWRDDNTGTLTSSGTQPAYTVTSNQGFASLGAMDGQTLTIKIHATNASSTAPTLNVDSLGAKNLTFEGSTNLFSNFLFTNTINRVTYNNSLGVFIISGETIGPYTLIPPGTVVPIATGFLNLNGTSWLPCDGAAISRSTYATLFGYIGTEFGVGDGSTTFNKPNIANLATSLAYYIKT